MRTASRYGLALFLCAEVATLPVTSAWAQGAPPAAPPPAASPAAPGDESASQAGAHFTRGVRLYQEDDFRAALIEFNRAYELSPRWPVLYNVGQSYYQLREYVAALNALEKYVREGGEQIPADRRAQVDREITELRGRVARVTVLSNVDGVDVALDDAPLGKASSEPLLVGAGRHTLAASRPGFVTASKVVDIAGGDTLTIRLDLAPQAPAAPGVVHEGPSYAGAIVGGVVGVAGIAVGTVFGVLTMNTKSTLDSECHADKTCPSSAQNDIDAYTRNGTLSGIGFGVGIVALALGTYSFFHERAKENPASARVRITPWMAPGGAGLTGSF
jgi:hypothetical protein